VTRNNSERTAGGNTKESMRHAAEVVVPYAMTASAPLSSARPSE
jgi:hypothetical protein